jgi:signal recognition particle receptor subunit beta
MVFFNYATMQMAAKIVYYGPGLCGKTTNLHHIYAKTSPQSRGEMVSLETETDRTLFFDLLPIDVGVIGGFKTRLQLYTIPGQVFYNTTRKLVLKGVDGIVFVADSQLAMLDANVESFKNLRENLAEIGLSIDEIPLVLQLNKRDLPSIASVDALLDTLDNDRKYEWVEAVASKGDGVFETLKTISKATLRTLRRRMTGAEEPVRPAAQRRDSGAFRVRTNDEASPARTVAGTMPLPQSPASTAKIPAFNPDAAPSASVVPMASAPPVIAPPMPEPEIETISAEDEVFTDSTLARAADAVPADIIADAPIAEAPLSAEAIEQEEIVPPTQYIPPTPAPPEPEKAVEQEIDFGQNEKAPAKPAADVKHVKVRSSVDIMAELEALRKRATTPKTSAPKKEAPIEIPMPAAPVPRAANEVRRSVSLQAAPGVLARTRAVRLTVSFESSDGTMQTEAHSIELDASDSVQSLSVDLKIV